MWWFRKRDQDVLCSKCYHRVPKQYCQVVKTGGNPIYFCAMHTVPYDKVLTVLENYGGVTHYQHAYYRTETYRVNEDGSRYEAPKQKKGA